jgi:hypothetical protein
MLVHQIITFGFACTPLYFVWEKLIGLHDCRSLCKRAAARLPVVVPIWFLAIVFPFFGPINSAVGSLLVSFTVYIIPALAHMVTYRSAHAREVTLMFYSPCFTVLARSTLCILELRTVTLCFHFSLLHTFYILWASRNLVALHWHAKAKL